jgi:hypothetical protein
MISRAMRCAGMSNTDREGASARNRKRQQWRKKDVISKLFPDFNAAGPVPLLYQKKKQLFPDVNAIVTVDRFCRAAAIRFASSYCSQRTTPLTFPATLSRGVRHSTSSAMTCLSGVASEIMQMRTNRPVVLDASFCEPGLCVPRLS